MDHSHDHKVLAAVLFFSTCMNGCREQEQEAIHQTFEYRVHLGTCFLTWGKMAHRALHSSCLGHFYGYRGWQIQNLSYLTMPP